MKSLFKGSVTAAFVSGILFTSIPAVASAAETITVSTLPALTERTSIVMSTQNADMSPSEKRRAEIRAEELKERQARIQARIKGIVDDHSDYTPELFQEIKSQAERELRRENMKAQSKRLAEKRAERKKKRELEEAKKEAEKPKEEIEEEGELPTPCIEIRSDLPDEECYRPKVPGDYPPEEFCFLAPMPYLVPEEPILELVCFGEI